MIIPQIEENFTRSDSLVIPEVCLVCGGTTIIDQDNNSKFLYCTNENCSAKMIKRFSHFVSRDAMNIDGLSDAGIELFIDKGFLKTFDDLYNLEQYKDQIIRLEGWGTRSYNKLIEAVNNSRKVKLANFIYALGIPNVGKGTSKIIAKTFKDSWFKFGEALAYNYNFTRLKDFGEITDQSLHEWFNDETERAMWINLTDVLEFVQEESKPVSSPNSPFSGKKVYATGTFANYKKEEIKSLLESLGAEFASGYAKSLDYLIEGSLKSSSKVDKAKKDGVPVLSEDEFLRLITI